MYIYRPNADDYSTRTAMLDKIDSVQDLFFKYVQVEPHSFLHAGYLSRTISHNGLEGKKILSVGIDLLKDSVLALVNKVELTVMDIDSEFISKCNSFCQGKLVGSHSDAVPRIRYVRQGVGESGMEGFIKEGGFEVLLLVQVDYLFKDEELSSLAKCCSESGVKHIIVLSPSLSSVITARRNIFINLLNLLPLAGDVVNSIRSLKYKKSGVPHHRRLFMSFNRLFKDAYALQEKTIYMYPSGKIHLLHYTLRS